MEELFQHRYASRITDIGWSRSFKGNICLMRSFSAVVCGGIHGEAPLKVIE